MAQAQGSGVVGGVTEAKKSFSPLAWAKKRHAMGKFVNSFVYENSSQIAVRIMESGIEAADVDAMEISSGGLPKNSTPLLAAIYLSNWDTARLLADLGCSRQASEAMCVTLVTGNQTANCKKIISAMIKSGHADPFKMEAMSRHGATTGLERMNAFELALRKKNGRFFQEMVSCIPAMHAQGLVDGFAALKSLEEMAVSAGHDIPRYEMEAIADEIKLAANQVQSGSLAMQCQQTRQVSSQEAQAKSQAEADAQACMEALVQGKFSEAKNAMASHPAGSMAWSQLSALSAPVPQVDGASALFPAGGFSAATVGPGLRCAMMSRFDCAIWLAQNGVKVDLDRQLLLACRHGSLDATRALLSCGANPLARVRGLSQAEAELVGRCFIPDCRGPLDALELCARSGHQGCAALICSALSEPSEMGRSSPADLLGSLRRSHSYCVGQSLADVSEGGKAISWGKAISEAISEAILLAISRFPDQDESKEIARKATLKRLDEVEGAFAEFQKMAMGRIEELSKSMADLTQELAYQRQAGLAKPDGQQGAPKRAFSLPVGQSKIAQSISERRESSAKALGQAHSEIRPKG